MKLIFEGLSIGKNFQFYCYARFKNSFIVRCLLVNIIYILNILVHHRYSVGKWIFNQKWCNFFFWNLEQNHHSKFIFVNAKKLILSYKISIFAFMKIVLEQRYLEIIRALSNGENVFKVFWPYLKIFPYLYYFLHLLGF